MDLEQLPALERSLTVEEKRHTEARQAGVRLPTHKCLGVCGLDLSLCGERGQVHGSHPAVSVPGACSFCVCNISGKE